MNDLSSIMCSWKNCKTEAVRSVVFDEGMFQGDGKSNGEINTSFPPVRRNLCKKHLEGVRSLIISENEPDPNLQRHRAGPD